MLTANPTLGELVLLGHDCCQHRFLKLVHSSLRARRFHTANKMSNKKHVTPLQIEAQRVSAEMKRRKQALVAAQQFSLRMALEKNSSDACHRPPATSAESSTAAAPPEFDVVRKRMEKERHAQSLDFQ